MRDALPPVSVVSTAEGRPLSSTSHAPRVVSLPGLAGRSTSKRTSQPVTGSVVAFVAAVRTETDSAPDVFVPAAVRPVSGSVSANTEPGPVPLALSGRPVTISGRSTCRLAPARAASRASPLGLRTARTSPVLSTSSAESRLKSA